MKKLYLVVTAISLIVSTRGHATPILNWDQPFSDVRVNVSHAGPNSGIFTVTKSGYGEITNSIADGRDCASAGTRPSFHGSSGTLLCQAPSVAGIGSPLVQAGGVSNPSNSEQQSPLHTDAKSSAQLWYSFYIDGAATAEPIPASLFYSLSAYTFGDPTPVNTTTGLSVGPFAYAVAGIYLREQYGPIVFSKNVVCYDSCSDSVDEQSPEISLFTGRSYDIMIIASSYTTNYVYNQTHGVPAIFWANSPSIAGAVAASFLQIDPSYANASNYRLVFSSGIANAPLDVAGNVPEPATWSMILIGFGLVGASMRYRGEVAARFA